ncbi:MAG: BA14K family protein, partial [Rhizobiaceae bacterium]
AAGAIIGMAARPRYYDDYYDDYYYDPGPRYILPRRAPARAYYGGGLDAHQQWCLNRWRSYDVRSDTYQPSRGDRRYCNSPYN